jgi:hypothetical protein
MRESKQVSENIQNGVFQLTSILRSVVGIESALTDVANSGLLEEVCNSISWTLTDIDVLSNIVRILRLVGISLVNYSTPPAVNCSPYSTVKVINGVL